MAENISDIVWRVGEQHYHDYLYRQTRKPANLNLYRQLAYFTYLSASILKDATANPTQLKLTVISSEVFVDMNVMRHAPHRKKPIAVSQRIPILCEADALMFNALIGMSSNNASAILDFSPLKYPRQTIPIYRYMGGFIKTLRAELTANGFTPYGNALRLLRNMRLFDLLVNRKAELGWTERLLGLPDDTFLLRLRNHGKGIRNSMLNAKLAWNADRPKSIELQQLKTLLLANP